MPERAFYASLLGRNATIEDEAISKIDYVLQYSLGLACIFGASASDRAALCRKLHTKYAANEEYLARLIERPDITSDVVFLKQISESYQLPLHRSQLDQSDELRKFLLAKNRERIKVVLFIDDAEVLRSRHLALLKKLLNWETDTEKVINIVLFGTETLCKLLLRPENRAFRSRIIATTRLDQAVPVEIGKVITTS